MHSFALFTLERGTMTGVASEDVKIDVALPPIKVQVPEKVSVP